MGSAEDYHHYLMPFSSSAMQISKKEERGEIG